MREVDRTQETCKMSKSWYIVRHAHKEKGNYYNPQLRHQDEPISQGGWQNSKKLDSFFSDKDIARIYISAYQRTRQTIETFAENCHLIPVVDVRLNEIDNGCIEGMTEQAIQQQYPEVWNAFVNRTMDFRFPNGETGEEAQQRIANFLEETRIQAHDGNLIVVSHEGLIRALMCYIVGIPAYKRWNFEVDFCGITEVTYQPDFHTWKLIRFNQSL